MRTTILSLSLILLVPSLPGGADTASGVQSAIRRQSDLSYAVLLEAGVKAGRLYSREQTASGAVRHYTEFLARQMVTAPRQASAVPRVISDD